MQVLAAPPFRSHTRQPSPKGPHERAFLHKVKSPIVQARPKALSDRYADRERRKNAWAIWFRGKYGICMCLSMVDIWSCCIRKSRQDSGNGHVHGSFTREQIICTNFYNASHEVGFPIILFVCHFYSVLASYLFYVALDLIQNRCSTYNIQTVCYSKHIAYKLFAIQSSISKIIMIILSWYSLINLDKLNLG